MTGLNNPAPDETPPPTTPAQILQHLDSLGISYKLYEHQALFKVSDGLEIERNMTGVHCRNLFIRDKKETMFLVVAANATKIDLKKLEGLLDCGRLSFGSAERLWQYLGVRPGSVCPYAIINDKVGAVQIVLDAHMMQGDIVNYHPLVNTMTIGVTPADLLKFIRSTGHEPRILDLSPAAPDEKQDTQDTKDA